jgi:hypothetical protein
MKPVGTDTDTYMGGALYMAAELIYDWNGEIE